MGGIGVGVGSAVQAAVSTAVANAASVLPTTRLRTVNDIEVAAMRVKDDDGLNQCCIRCAGHAEGQHARRTLENNRQRPT